MVRIIIDAGHGWFTKGKNSLFFKILKGIFKGKPVLRENNVNEAICNKISVLHSQCDFITAEWQDIPLKERVAREHRLYEKDKTLFVSIHADAFKEKNKAAGGTVFYYSEKGKKIASYLTNFMTQAGYDIAMRKPKKANFMVIRETKSPAVLIELGFMTTEFDLNLLQKDSFRNKTAKILTQAFKEMPQSYLL